jgi:hypothetical protein
MHLGSVAQRGHSLPHDAVVIAPAAEARSAKVPPDGPEGSQLVYPKDHVVSFQWDHEEINDELILIDEDVHRPANACASHPIPVCHGDMQTGLGQRLEMKPPSRQDGDE